MDTTNRMNRKLSLVAGIFFAIVALNQVDQIPNALNLDGVSTFAQSFYAVTALLTFGCMAALAVFMILGRLRKIQGLLLWSWGFVQLISFVIPIIRLNRAVTVLDVVGIVLELAMCVLMGLYFFTGRRQPGKHGVWIAAAAVWAFALYALVSTFIGAFDDIARELQGAGDGYGAIWLYIIFALPALVETCFNGLCFVVALIMLPLAVIVSYKEPKKKAAPAAPVATPAAPVATPAPIAYVPVAAPVAAPQLQPAWGASEDLAAAEAPAVASVVAEAPQAPAQNSLDPEAVPAEAETTAFVPTQPVVARPAAPVITPPPAPAQPPVFTPPPAPAQPPVFTPPPVPANPPAAPVQNVSPQAQQLFELKYLLDSGLITQADFDAKKKQILNL